MEFKKNNLFKRNKSGRVGGTNTGTTVLDRSVSHGEFTKVMSDHLRLDFDGGEGLSIVDTNNTTSHLWFDHHVTAMSFDKFWFLQGLAVLLCLSQPLEDGFMTSLHTTVECTSRTSAVER